MSARISAQFALRRGRITGDQIDLISSCKAVYGQEKWFGEFVNSLSEGKLSPTLKQKLAEFIDHASDDEEE